VYFLLGIEEGRYVGISTPAISALVRAGIAHRVHEINHDPRVTAYGQEAAESLGVEPARVFKTLICSARTHLAVAIVPVAGELDLKAMAAALGSKSVVLADGAIAERATGYVLGGISPIGQKRRLPTWLDQSAVQWETIFVSGGRRGLELELAPTDLLAITHAQLAAIGKAA
jgi:Cys-tRNA(Pro)/Cys-tRNA(Cys) deacylase